jgi:hypothetical protein
MKKMKKTNHDERRDSFSRRTGRASHCLGPPSCIPSPIRPSSGLDPPTSLWKREGQLLWVRVSERNEAFIFEPTSLERGEGLVSGRFCEVGGESRWRGRR